MELDEKELVRRCRAGDLASFDELMRRYEKKVYSLCFRMAGNPEDAADLAQEAFLKAYRAMPAFRGGSTFSTWLFRIVVNTCMDEHRRRSRRPVVYSLDRRLDSGEGEICPAVPDHSPGPQALALQSELQEEIRNLLARLPADQRLVIIMRDLEGYSYEEMAEALQLPMGTVKSRLNRARSRLRQLYLAREELFRYTGHPKEKGGWSHDLQAGKRTDV